MPREVMTRKASDNEYFHQDFHGSLSIGIEYLHEHYGEDAVRQYLRQFALAFYAPLRKALADRGLPALKEHFEKVYRREGGKIQIDLSEGEMVLKVDACPAIAHMRREGYQVARLFHETTKTVNEAICEGSEFSAELVEYDQQTGRSVQRFTRRSR